MVTSKLVQYMDQDLPATVFRQITEHLDECYECAEEFHELVRVTDLARQSLRCPVYHDGYELLRAQLALQPGTENILYFPRRLRVLRSVLTGTAVTAAILLFVVSVGIPAIETMQTIDAVIDAQADGSGPVAAPTEAGGHSLLAWSSQIRWAENLSLDVQQAPPEQSVEEQDAPAAPEPITRALPENSPHVVLPPFCKSRVIVLA